MSGLRISFNSNLRNLTCCFIKVEFVGESFVDTGGLTRELWRLLALASTSMFHGPSESMTSIHSAHRLQVNDFTHTRVHMTQNHKHMNAHIHANERTYTCMFLLSGWSLLQTGSVGNTFCHS